MSAESTPPKSPLVRAGYWSCGAGLVVTFVGMVILAQDNSRLEPLGSGIHRAGLVWLLISFAMVLLGYRLSQIRRLLAAMPENTNDPPRKQVEIGAYAPVHSDPVWQFSLRGLVILAAVAIPGFLGTFAVPPPFSIVLTIYTHAALVATMLVVIVYDRTLLRAFCLGAVAPAALSIMGLNWIGPLLMNGRFSGSFAFQLAIAMNWAMILLTGTLAIVVRLWLATDSRKASPANVRRDEYWQGGS